MFYHQEEEYLPWSNQRYTVNRDGIVKENQEKIQTAIIDNERMIELDWYDGKKLYRYDIIPVLCYLKIKIPKKDLDRVELIYKDSNKDNLDIDNLAYRFRNGPVESEDFPGYYYVPYYTDYVIDRTGDVISLKNYRRRKTIEHKKWTISKPVQKKNIKGGYWCGRGKRDDGVDGISRHRALALTFIPYSIDPLSIIVNHKNGIPGNDWLDNLEWSTYSENTKHAYQNNLYPSKVTPIVFLDENQGIEKRYPTIANCIEDTGFTCGFIYGRIEMPHVDYLDGFRFKLDDGNDWAERTIVRASSIIRTVVARNVYTGIINIFESKIKASECTGVNKATIGYHCKNKTTIPTKGYNFRFAAEDIDWPSHSELHLRMYRRFPEGIVPFGILLLDDKNQIVTFYEGLEDFMNSTGLREGQVLYLLNHNKTFRGHKVQKFDVKGTL